MAREERGAGTGVGEPPRALSCRDPGRLLLSALPPFRCSLRPSQPPPSRRRLPLGAAAKTGFQFYYLPAVYILVFIIGFLGNSVAIWMFVFHMKPWSGISVYMFNLALADFLYVLTLPALIFYYFNKTDWIFGDAMCKLQRFIFHVNLYGSILFLTCISAHRYSGVVYPLKSLGRLKKKNAVYISVLVWLIVVVAISPILFYSGTLFSFRLVMSCNCLSTGHHPDTVHTVQPSRPKTG